MTAAGMQGTAMWRTDRKPLFWALVVSIGVHAVLFWLLVVVGLAMAAFSSTQKKVLAESQRLQALREKQKITVPQLVFVETDPAVAVPEAPKDAKYYSSHSTQAANPDAKVETDAPKIDGTQTHAPDTKDVPRSKMFPLQPSPPKPGAPEEKSEPKPAPKPEPKAAQPPGDLALLTKPSAPSEQKPDPTPQQPPEHQRPHTLAEVQQIKMQQDGGVSRHRLDASFDTQGSPLGEYDERVVAAIRQHWYDLIDSKRVALDHVGKVVIEFRLNYDGRVTDLKVLDSDVGDLLSYLCQAAITDPAPYERWPEAMRRMIDAPYREVTFTFYYE